jgi:alpha-tubulin suppressor-like RCC1 family protein
MMRAAAADFRLRLLHLLLHLRRAGGQDGSIWAWGGGDNLGTDWGGALGLRPAADAGSSVHDGRPLWVDELGAGAVARVSAGRDHTVVLQSDGSVWTFGSGLAGQLGHGDTRSRLLPTRVSSGLLGSEVTHVAAGSGFTVAVRQSGKRGTDGTRGTTVWRVFSWGLNDWGQLGHGHRAAAASSPRLVAAPLRSSELAAGGAQPGALEPSVHVVRAGGRHTLVLLEDGRVFGWGSNEHGQLGLPCAAGGDPGAAGCVLTAPRQLAAGVWPEFVDIAAGGEHSVLLSSAGRLWVSGRNDRGQLGLGDTADRHAFAEVSESGSVI